MSDSTHAAAWQHCPWGMAAIGTDGRVSAVNPAGAALFNQPDAELLGQGEADLVALIKCLPHDHQRVETPQDALRCLHFLSPAADRGITTGHLAHIAEMLREPLASIHGFTELLLTQDYDDATRRGLTATMLAEIEAMANIINQQLDIRKGRPAAGDKESVPATRHTPDGPA